MVSEHKFETKVVNVQWHAFDFYTFAKDAAQPSKPSIFPKRAITSSLFPIYHHLPSC